MDEFIYHSSPKVTFASNTFINVPTILQFDETPLISVVREAKLGFTTQIPIYHSDGTYLARVRGTRVYPTEEGKLAGVEVKRYSGLWVCTADGRTVFEIRQQPGDAFRTDAELYTPNGFFLRIADQPKPQLLNPRGEELRIGGLVCQNCVFENMRIGVLMRSDGSMAVGVG